MARNTGRSYTSEEIAKSTQIPPRYVYRVLQALTQAGLVRSQPGPGGGYTLEHDPKNTSLLDVVLAISPVERIRCCPLGLKSHDTLCPLHQELDDAYAAMEQALSRVTVGEVLRARGRVPPLMEVKT
jgi:Rrf2 family protein